jgi:hypothetical protein
MNEVVVDTQHGPRDQPFFDAPRMDTAAFARATGGGRRVNSLTWINASPELPISFLRAIGEEDRWTR